MPYIDYREVLGAHCTKSLNTALKIFWVSARHLYIHTKLKLMNVPLVNKLSTAIIISSQEAVGLISSHSEKHLTTATLRIIPMIMFNVIHQMLINIKVSTQLSPF